MCHCYHKLKVPKKKAILLDIQIKKCKKWAVCFCKDYYQIFEGINNSATTDIK